jgi:hypothetical protein
MIFTAREIMLLARQVVRPDGCFHPSELIPLVMQRCRIGRRQAKQIVEQWAREGDDTPPEDRTMFWQIDQLH